MSLDIMLSDDDDNVLYETNITHNLAEMARYAGIYQCLWNPTEEQRNDSSLIIEPLTIGLIGMVTGPDYYNQFNAENGWGTRSQFVGFLSRLISALYLYPHSEMVIWK